MMPSTRFFLTVVQLALLYTFASGTPVAGGGHSCGDKDLEIQCQRQTALNRLEAAFSHGLVSLRATKRARAYLESRHNHGFVERQSDNTTLIIPTDVGNSSTTVDTSTTSFLTTDTTTTTLSSTSTSTPDEPPPTQSTVQTGILIPITVTTTDTAGQVETQTTPIFQSSASISVVAPVTSTNDQGQIVTGTATLPGLVVTDTNSLSQTVTSTLPVSVATVIGGSLVNTAAIKTATDSTGGILMFSATRSGQVVSATKKGGSVVVITFTPTPVYVSEIVYRTTLLPNGQRSTITQLEVVGAAGPTSSPDGSGSSPKLATDGAVAPMVRKAAAVALLIGGILAIVMMF